MKKNNKPKSHYKKPINVNKTAFNTIKIVLTVIVFAIFVMAAYSIFTFGWNTFISWIIDKWGCLVLVVAIIAASLFMWIYSIVKDMKKVIENE